MENKNNIQLNDELLKKIFLNFNEVVSIGDINDLNFKEEDIFNIYQNVIDYVSQNDKALNYKNLNNKEDIIFFLIVYYWDFTKQFKLDFIEQILASVILSALYLSKASSNSLYLVNILLSGIEDLNKYSNNILKFIDSYDLRGLLFWLCKDLLDVNFDKINKKKIDYEYSPPKVSENWIKKYKQESEPIEFWLYNTFIGNGLFVVLYTPKCRYAKCTGCNLPTLSSSEDITSQESIYKQVDFVLNDSISLQEKNDIKEIILSNNGNMFDTQTMPVLSLLYIINNCINQLTDLKKVTLESRLEYLNDCQFQSLKDTIDISNRKIELQVAVGFEIFDENYRNKYYRKNLSFRKIEKSMELFSKYGIAVKFYMMFKSVPGLSLADSIEDINKASTYFFELSKKFNVNINMHISPTYVATGTDLEKEYYKGNYNPPTTSDINSLYDNLKVHDSVSYYISMNDEGLADETLLEQSDYNEYLILKDKINNFNITQSITC